VSARGTFSEWLGVFLDTTGADRVDWDEIAAIVDDAYRQVAPRTLIAELELAAVRKSTSAARARRRGRS
jgi:hypothetical protein